MRKIFLNHFSLIANCDLKKPFFSQIFPHQKLRSGKAFCQKFSASIKDLSDVKLIIQDTAFSFSAVAVFMWFHKLKVNLSICCDNVGDMMSSSNQFQTRHNRKRKILAHHSNLPNSIPMAQISFYWLYQLTFLYVPENKISKKFFLFSTNEFLFDVSQWKLLPKRWEWKRKKQREIFRIPQTNFESYKFCGWEISEQLIYDSVQMRWVNDIFDGLRSKIK